MSAITHLFAGVPVSDLEAGIDWYTRFEHATLFIEPNAARAGAGRITFAVDGLDALLERLTAHASAPAP